VKLGYRHEALVYSGDAGFVRETVPFLRAAIEAGEPTLVVVDQPKVEALRDALDGERDAVAFADMAEVGHNPARLIPAWRDFVAAHPNRAVRGIGEPIGPWRGPDELVECQQHESLLNLALADAAALWLLCPYDASVLPASVIDEAFRSHPFVMERSSRIESPWYAPVKDMSLFAASLSEPPADALDLAFRVGPLDEVRRVVAREAERGGLSDDRTRDLVVAVNEVASNSLLHGGGEGRLRVWSEPDRIVCEIRDPGIVTDPLIGRVRPSSDRLEGRGVWLANQLCDLVQLRVLPSGTVVRMHMVRGIARP